MGLDTKTDRLTVSRNVTLTLLVYSSTDIDYNTSRNGDLKMCLISVCVH
jgi:hypothetical protein